MKTIITSITLISIFSILHLKAQDSYLEFQYYAQASEKNVSAIVDAEHSKFIYAEHSSDKPTTAISDATGNSYTTIIIGEQVWLKENLNTTFYNNGDPILDGTNLGDISKEKDARYWFDYNNNAETGYGKLYNWDVIKDARGICPSGFHVATNEDWSTLIDQLGGNAEAAEAIKTADNEIWPHSNFTSSDQSFEALPGRLRPSDESFCLIEPSAFWWVNESTNSNEARAFKISSKSSAITSNYKSKNTGMSIRCVMDNYLSNALFEIQFNTLIPVLINPN